MATPVATVDETGIHIPPLSEVLDYLKDQYRGIYGQDTYLENDSQDGQFLGILAQALSDANAVAVAIYNAFSPSTAQGVGLSRVVKINGIARLIPTYSSVDLRLIGQAGTTISNGLASDGDGNRWRLPASVTIPAGGEITVTATAVEIGAVRAPAHTITTIATPTRGWQSVDNPQDATPGAPVESDVALRKRQTISTEIPSQTLFEGVIGAVANITGVTRYAGFENDGYATDDKGIPAKTMALVVEGGDAQTIADRIFAKKGSAGTYGTTAKTVTDPYGIPHTIRFYRPTIVPITASISLKALNGFTTTIQQAIRQQMSDYINALGIWGAMGYVRLTRLYLPANLNGGVGSSSFEITSLTIARDGAMPAAADVPILFNEAPSCTPDSISISVS